MRPERTHPLWHPILCGVALLAAWAAPAWAGQPLGRVEQLSGFAVAQGQGGKLRFLAVQSGVAVGETLVTEEGSYVLITLADGRTATLGPGTRLTVAGPGRLELHGGALEVRSAADAAMPLVVVAGDSTLDGSRGSFVAHRIPEPPGRAALSQRAYARAALASVDTGTVSDAGAAGPLWDSMAQFVPPAAVPSSRPVPPGASTLSRPGLPPGLYLQVIDGLINVSNKGGTANFSAGQFGFTPSFSQPPVLILKNPGLQFTPPPAFSMNPGNTGATPKPAPAQSVDCEVR